MVGDHSGPFHPAWSDACAMQHNHDVVRSLIRRIGDDPTRDGLLETPKRVCDSWKEIFGGYKVDIPGLFKAFKEDHDELVVLHDIEFYSMCEHHMLPFFGKAHVGYLPDGKIVGISKLARLVDAFARRLQVQERLGQQVADAIMENLGAQGCGVVLRAEHLCMRARGVGKQESILTTSSLRGSFRQDKQVREEFLALVRTR